MSKFGKSDDRTSGHTGQCPAMSGVWQPDGHGHLPRGVSCVRVVRSLGGLQRLSEFTRSYRSENSGKQQMPKFQKGVSGNPGGRPKLPAEMKEMFQAKAPEAFEVLCRHLNAKDPRVAVAAATQILDRAYGRPMQQVDANINEDNSVRYYAEVPKPCLTTEE